jgi:hypothetical protein
MRHAYKVVVGKPERRDLSEDIGVDGRIILEWILKEIGWEGMDCIHLAQDRCQWRASVYTVMSLQVP